MVVQVHGPSLGQVPRLGYRRATELAQRESGNDIEEEADASEPATTNNTAKGPTVKEHSARR